MKDFGSLTGNEMFARREAAEKVLSELIGKLVFKYSRLVTGLHLCVAWHDEGKGLGNYGAIADDLAVAELLKRIENQARTKLGNNSREFKKYRVWVRRAHELRVFRNLLMHSRLEIEAYGRHAIATSSIFVEPVRATNFTIDELEKSCNTCDMLINDLYALRREHPL
ncbi:MAG TPA: hypothetical protein VIT22_09535 [Pseudoxanthomonas sp.]